MRLCLYRATDLTTSRWHWRKSDSKSAEGRKTCTHGTVAAWKRKIPNYAKLDVTTYLYLLRLTREMLLLDYLEDVYKTAIVFLPPLYFTCGTRVSTFKQQLNYRTVPDYRVLTLRYCFISLYFYRCFSLVFQPPYSSSKSIDVHYFLCLGLSAPSTFCRRSSIKLYRLIN